MITNWRPGRPGVYRPLSVQRARRIFRVDARFFGEYTFGLPWVRYGSQWRVIFDRVRRPPPPRWHGPHLLFILDETPPLHPAAQRRYVASAPGEPPPPPRVLLSHPDALEYGNRPRPRG